MSLVPYAHLGRDTTMIKRLCKDAEVDPMFGVTRVMVPAVVPDAIYGEVKMYSEHVWKYWIEKWIVDLVRIVQDPKTNMVWADAVNAFKAGAEGDFETLNAFIGYYELAREA